jgi:hypothetical protein
VFGAPAAPGHLPSLAHQPAGTPSQHAVSREADDVVHSGLAIEEVEDLRISEAAIKTHQDSGARKGAADLRNHPTQDTQDPQTVTGVAGSQEGGEEILLGVVIEAQEPEEGGR